MNIKTSAVVFRSDLYPRRDTSPSTVQKYAEDLSVLPPIEINQNNILIDGWHRWMAHRKEGVDTIHSTVTEVAEAQLFSLAVERNATHGLQLIPRGQNQARKRAIGQRALERANRTCRGSGAGAVGLVENRQGVDVTTAERRGRRA